MSVACLSIRIRVKKEKEEIVKKKIESGFLFLLTNTVTNCLILKQTSTIYFSSIVSNVIYKHVYLCLLTKYKTNTLTEPNSSVSMYTNQEFYIAFFLSYRHSHITTHTRPKGSVFLSLAPFLS
jgi:hypothetical protein